MKYTSVILVCLLAVAASAYGDYTLWPKVGGASSATVNQGDMFVMELVLTSDGADTHSSAIFTLEFEKPGLIYNFNGWVIPYDIDGIDNASEPGNADLPVTGDVDTWSDIPSEDPGSIDIYLENFVPQDGEDFTTGALVVLSMTVPIGFSPGEMTITAVPDTFDNGWGSVTTIGESFTLDVPYQLGDMNGSNGLDEPNGNDINPFVMALVDRPAYEAAYPGIDADIVGDINQMGDGLNGNDIHPFVDLLVGGSQAIPEPATLALLVVGACLSLLRRRK